MQNKQGKNGNALQKNYIHNVKQAYNGKTHLLDDGSVAMTDDTPSARQLPIFVLGMSLLWGLQRSHTHVSQPCG